MHYADGLLYGLTENDQTVLLIRPEPTEFVLISSFELPNDAEGATWAHPVVLDGRLYIRHSQFLYCFDIRAEQEPARQVPQRQPIESVDTRTDNPFTD